jgi:hypothetical protein
MARSYFLRIASACQGNSSQSSRRPTLRPISNHVDQVEARNVLPSLCRAAIITREVRSKSSSRDANGWTSPGPSLLVLAFVKQSNPLRPSEDKYCICFSQAFYSRSLSLSGNSKSRCRSWWKKVTYFGGSGTGTSLITAHGLVLPI